MIRPSECWRCRAVAEERGLMPSVFRIFHERGQEAAQAFVDEQLATEHESCERSWV